MILVAVVLAVMCLVAVVMIWDACRTLSRTLDAVPGRRERAGVTFTVVAFALILTGAFWIGAGRGLVLGP